MHTQHHLLIKSVAIIARIESTHEVVGCLTSCCARSSSCPFGPAAPSIPHARLPCPPAARSAHAGRRLRHAPPSCLVFHARLGTVARRWSWEWQGQSPSHASAAAVPWRRRAASACPPRGSSGPPPPPSCRENATKASRPVHCTETYSVLSPRNDDSTARSMSSKVSMSSLVLLGKLSAHGGCDPKSHSTSSEVMATTRCGSRSRLASRITALLAVCIVFVPYRISMPST